MTDYFETLQIFRDLNFKNPLESHFSFNKKCFVGRTVMIQSALHSPDLVEYFTYLERMRTMIEKFSTGSWSQSFCQNPHELIEYSEAWQRFRNMNFKNPLKVTLPSTKDFRSSHGHDSKFAVFQWCRRMFYILRTYAYDAWNVSTGVWSQSVLSGFLKFMFLNLCQASEYSMSLCGFWQILWLQEPVEIFSTIVRIRSEYVKHTTRSGECNALWIMTVRPTKHFYWRKNDFRVDFWNSNLWSFAKFQNILSFCVFFFWQILWLQTPVENFLCVVSIRSEYSKHSPRSPEHSALRMVFIRRIVVNI